MNLLCKYDSFLELSHLDEKGARFELRSIFRRDFESNTIYFLHVPLSPMPGEAENLERVFEHLISYDPGKNRFREFDRGRSKLLHWVLPHVDSAQASADCLLGHNFDVFQIDEKGATKAYVLNHHKKYLVVLEKQRKSQSFFLVTAFPLSDDRRYKEILNKMKRGQVLKRQKAPR